MFLKLMLALSMMFPTASRATVFGSVRGVVHDPDHRPVEGARVALKPENGDYSLALATDVNGAFEAAGVPVGACLVTVTRDGFAPSERQVVVSSSGAPVLHFQLALGEVRQTVEAPEAALAVNPEQMTPETVISRAQIDAAPGADLSNSLNAITDFVPGAYITHDQLHMRGGHQVTWAMDGVPIPNTNIASNVGPQIDPKDIDYLEAQRGGYSSAYGDRTYGVFNVVPRTGFERDNEGELFTTFGTFSPDQRPGELRGPHGEVRLLRQRQRQPQRLRPGNSRSGGAARSRLGPRRAWASLIYNRDANNQFRLVTSLAARRLSDPQRSGCPGGGRARRGARARRAGQLLLGAHLPARPAADGLAVLSLQPRQLRRRARTTCRSARCSIANRSMAGAQIALNAVAARHDATVGVYGFGQHDDESVGLTANDGSGLSLAQARITTGHLEALLRGRPVQGDWSWLTLDRGSAADALQRRRIGERGQPAARRSGAHPAPELGPARLLGLLLPGAAALHRGGAAARLCRDPGARLHPPAGRAGPGTPVRHRNPAPGMVRWRSTTITSGPRITSTTTRSATRTCSFL